jgi:hypothetical protein
MFLVLNSCQSFDDGPLAVTDTNEDLYKLNSITAPGKQLRVTKANFECCDVKEIHWRDSDFELPDFNLQPFTITSVEVCIITDNETTMFTSDILGKVCQTSAAECQLATSLCWEGEYPEEHPFYDGFEIHIASTELLEAVEASCTITYLLN